MVQCKRIIDVSLRLEDGIICYQGDAPFRSEAICIIESSRCNMAKLTLATHTGTHIESPSSSWKEGKGWTNYHCAPQVVMGLLCGRFYWSSEPCEREAS